MVRRPRTGAGRGHPLASGRLPPASVRWTTEPECNPPHTLRPFRGPQMTEVAEPATQGEVFPLERSCPFAPPPAYEKLREAGPVQRVGLPNGSDAWAITRLEEVRQMLTDPRFSSNRF